MGEYPPLGIVPRDRIGEDHEGHQGVTLVIGSLGIIAVWREQQFGLTQEAGVAGLVRTKQRAIHHVPVVE